MLCEHCRKKIIKRRNLYNLLETESHHLCESCYQRYPLLPSYEVIPIDSGVIHLFTMIKKSYPVKPSCYQSFLKSYYDLHQKSMKDLPLLIFDYMDEDVFDILDHMSFGDLMIVRHYENIIRKGEKL